MGHFLAVTAIKTDDVDSVAECIDEYAKGYGVKSQIIRERIVPKEDRHALLYPVKNDWCVVLWPEYFNIHDVPAAKYISDKTSAFVSTVNVYDGDYWCHSFFRAGEQVDSFCSMPGYWAENEEELNQNIERFKGSPELVAKELGVPVDQIQGYYQQIIEDKEYSKVNASDEFELTDFWVFTDFWNRLGIVYPEDMGAFVAAVDLTMFFAKRLPETEA